MTLKAYVRKNKIRVSSISSSSGIPYTTVSDVINGNTDIDNVSVKVFMRLSEALGLSMPEFYKLAKSSSPTPDPGRGYALSIKNGKYYINKGKDSYFLCRNTPVQAAYIREIADTFIGNLERKERMDSWQIML